MATTLRHIVPKHVEDKLSDQQKACVHEWKNTRTSLHPIVWVHLCKLCGAKIPM